MRNRTYGGVRGRKTKVGEKLLRFPPTRFFIQGLRRNTLHSSPFAWNPLCLSAFREVKSIRALFTYSSPLFTFLHLFVSADLRFFFCLEALCLGEEWWSVGEESPITLHPLETPCLWAFQGIRWRVKSFWRNKAKPRLPSSSRGFS